MGGSEGVTRAATTYFDIRIWSAPLALGQLRRARLADRAGARQAGARRADRRSTSSTWRRRRCWCWCSTSASPVRRCRRHRGGGRARARRPDRAAPFARATCGRLARRCSTAPKLMRMLAVNRDIMIRTAALIAAFLFFTAQGARAGDVDAGRQRGVEQFPPDQRVLPRRPRQRRRATMRPRLWRARPQTVSRRGPAGDRSGDSALRWR